LGVVGGGGDANKRVELGTWESWVALANNERTTGNRAIKKSGKTNLFAIVLAILKTEKSGGRETENTEATRGVTRGRRKMVDLKRSSRGLELN